MGIDLNKRIWQWIMLITLAFMWGSSFILMKRGLESYTNNQVAALRMLIASILFIPFIIRQIKFLSKNNIIYLIIIGFIGNFFPAFLYTKAQTEISSALAGMLNSLVPIFALIIGTLVYKDKNNIVNITGIVIGLIGAIGLVFFNSSINIFSGNNLYGLLIILATIFYAISINLIKHKVNNLSGTTVAALSFLFIGPFAGIYLIFSDFSAALSSPDYIDNFIYIVILAIFSSFIAVILFNILIKYTSTIFSASVTYIIPVFAIMWGIIDEETITLSQMIFITIIMLGVYLVNKR